MTVINPGARPSISQPVNPSDTIAQAQQSAIEKDKKAETDRITEAMQAQDKKSIDKSNPTKNDFLQKTPFGRFDSKDAQSIFDQSQGLITFPAIHALDRVPFSRVADFTVPNGAAKTVRVFKDISGGMKVSIIFSETPMNFTQFNLTNTGKLVHGQTQQDATPEDYKLIGDALLNGTQTIDEKIRIR